jgi:hypothetical protein
MSRYQLIHIYIQQYDGKVEFCSKTCVGSQELNYVAQVDQNWNGISRAVSTAVKCKILNSQQCPNP